MHGSGRLLRPVTACLRHNSQSLLFDGQPMFRAAVLLNPYPEAFRYQGSAARPESCPSMTAIIDYHGETKLNFGIPRSMPMYLVVSKFGSVRFFTTFSRTPNGTMGPVRALTSNLGLDHRFWFGSGSNAFEPFPQRGSLFSRKSSAKS